MSTTSDRRVRTEAIIAQFRNSLRELRCLGGDRLRRAGISHTTFHIAAILERHGEMPMGRLAEMLGVSLSNASGLIDRLEEEGVVERIRVPEDRRVVLVRATDHGRKMLADLEVLKEELLQRILGHLDDVQLARVAAALSDIQGAAMAELSTGSTPGWHVHEPGRPPASSGVTHA